MANPDKNEYFHGDVSVPAYNNQWDKAQFDDDWDSGESLELTTGGCGNYDLKMVDEDSDVCEVTEIYMCGDHGNINLTDDDLLDCISN